MPVGILFPAPAANRPDTVCRDSTTGLKLSALDPKVWVTGIIHPLCRPTDAAERNSSALVTQTLMLLLVLACKWVKSCTGLLCLPRESRDRMGPPLLMATEMLHLCYLMGIAAGAAYVQDCRAVIPFSRRWRCGSVKCKHTKLPPGLEEEWIGLVTDCVLLFWQTVFSQSEIFLGIIQPSAPLVKLQVHWIAPGSLWSSCWV